MTRDELAAKLNGREYCEEMTRDEELEAKESGLIVAFGASDDLVEFRGAFDDEIGAWGGRTIEIISRRGKLAIVDDDIRESAETLGVDIPVLFTITAEWSPTRNDFPDTSWLITASVAHSPFSINEEGDLYCIGCVIDMKDLIEQEME